MPHPRFQSTRAITIDAPPERVWPWIVQMGIYSAGFYSHDRVERALFHARYVEGKHSATRTYPKLQDLKVGDLVPYGRGVYAAVAQLEPNQHLVAGEAFVLRPLPGNRTRLIVRYRGTGYISAAADGVDATAGADAEPQRLRGVPAADRLPARAGRRFAAVAAPGRGQGAGRRHRRHRRLVRHRMVPDQEGTGSLTSPLTPPPGPFRQHTTPARFTRGGGLARPRAGPGPRTPPPSASSRPPAAL